MNIKRAVITGATGAIGMALLAELIQNGIEVLVLCREGGRAARIPKHPLITLKYCELSDLSVLENDTGKSFDVFYHLAWAGTTGAARNDTLLQNENVRYAIDAVAAAERFGCRTFVGIGSQAEYGRFEGQLTPSTPTFPENGYGIAKLAAGAMTRIEAERRGMGHVWVRVLSVYGPHDGENSLITSTIRKLLAGERPKFTAGEQLWDFLYSKDAARALYLLGERGKNGAVYVLGSGEARPLKEYVLALCGEVAPETPITLGEIPYAPLQVMHLCADISAITADTGWTPTTDFAEGIKETISWARNGKD